MIVNNIRPTSHQKTVLAIISNAATPRIAAEEILSNPNTKEAADLLQQLGAVIMSNNEAQLSDTGQQLAVDENIVDEMGGLTTNGTMYLKMHQKDQGEDDQSEPNPMGEGFSLISELLSLTK